jgi:aldehyde dehydrogenase (NAD+)
VGVECPEPRIECVHTGYGREAGLDALLDHTRTKTTWINLSDAPVANPFVVR